jgi:chemotaxis response regulator CheB
MPKLIIESRKQQKLRLDAERRLKEGTAPCDAHRRHRRLGRRPGGAGAVSSRRTPPNSGMAYVVVQHLDPTQKACLPELLQRVTAMPVREANRACASSPTTCT